MSTQKKWLIVIASLVVFLNALWILFPVIDGSANVLVNVPPVLATLFFGLKTGALITLVSWIGAVFIFMNISVLPVEEGLIRLPIPFLLTLLVCFGADRLRLYLKQRKQAEHRLRASKEQYRLIFEHSADGIVLLDSVGVIIDASPGVKTHTGYDPVGLVGQKFQDIGIFSVESTVEIIDRVGKNALGTTEIEVSGKNRENQPIYLQLTLSRIAPEQGGWCWICLLKNTTERRDMMVRLQEAQKMKAIGRLAGGVAHDLNNILNAIVGSVHAHRHEIAGCNGSFEDLDNIASACNRGAKLTQNLLGFARKSAVSRDLFCLNSAIKGVLSIVNRTSLKSIRHDLRLAPKLPMICGDQSQIENAIMNICLNAHDAMGNDGLLTLQTEFLNNEVRVHITDTGEGMADVVRQRAFEPFFTTKPVGKGTGLGLSMVYGVMQSHGGTVEIDSTPKEGTSVTLTFPKAIPKVHACDEVPVSKGTSKISENVLFARTVLLVDDEPLVLRAGMRMLQTLGCRVLSAQNGYEAVEIYSENMHDVSLVILDLIMPDMDGTETMERLRAVDETLPILLASGYTQEVERVSALKNTNACGFLPKPYHSDALIAAAKEVLQHQAA